MGKKLLSSILCAVMALSFVACGQQEAETVVTDNKEYVYVPEYITLSDGEDDGYYSNLTLKGNNLYYSQYSYDVEAMTSTETICQYSLQDGSVEQIPISLIDGRNVSGFTLDGNGNIYTVVSDYSVENVDENGYSVPDIYINKYDAQGAIVYEKDITEIINREAQDPYISKLLVDEQGHIYVCLDSSVILLKEDGEEQGAVAINDGWINSIGLGKDGKVYFSYYDYTSSTGGMVLSEIDFEGKKIGETYNNLPSINGDGFAVGITKDFLINDGSKVYEYDLSTQTYEEVFSWLDCDIDGGYVSCVGVAEDGTIVAVIDNWDTSVTEIARLNKKNASEVVQKEEIVIGALYDDQQLQAAAVAFNKASDKYRVTIKTYIDTNNWEEDSYDTALTNLQNDIVSGTNCPDIINLSQLPEETQLTSKGVFEDLTPFLEQSSVLNKEDFLESVLEAFSYDGKLISIPITFNMQTLVGKTSVVGDEMGWSLEEMMNCVKEYPNAVLLEGFQKSTVLQTSLLFNQDSFVDWEKGECYFDTDTFKQVLEFANMFPDEYDWENYDGSGTVEKLQSDGILLETVVLYDLQEIQTYEARFGEPVTFIGYPTTDGSMGCCLFADSRYGIVAKSENKEGAWAFIESYLTSGDDSRYSWGIPTQKAEFEQMITDATTPDYVVDEEGNPVFDENGEAILSGSSSISSDGWEYTYRTPTMEEAETLRNLVAGAKPMIFMENDLAQIITEEAEAYFAGQKTIDEVVDIIQSRAQIYISENI